MMQAYISEGLWDRKSQIVSLLVYTYVDVQWFLNIININVITSGIDYKVVTVFVY